MIQRRATMALAAAAALLIQAPLWAQDAAWPSKPLKIVVPFAAGGSADLLARRGVRATVVDAAAASGHLPTAGDHAVDLVVDAAYGTGLGRPFDAPTVVAPVLAVDLPSGLDGLTGEARGRPLSARRTVTFAALKPGLLFGDGPALAGRVEVVDLGLDVSGATSYLLTDGDIAGLVPPRPADAHKWQRACWVIAGSSGMEGAAGLAATAALRAGAA